MLIRNTNGVIVSTGTCVQRYFRRYHLLPLVICLVAALLPQIAFAGINKKLVIKADTPEGNFLALISLETDYDKRLALIGQFTVMFPKSESIGWAYSQIQDANIRDGLWDQAIQAGDKLLELDPDDLEAARYNLQAAKSKADKALVKKYTEMNEAIAQRVVTAAVVADDPDDAATQKETRGIGRRPARSARVCSV